jgi:uncharacterized protein (TIGR02271 family)
MINQTDKGSVQGAHQRMITAFFDNREDASEAVERLTRLGLTRDNIKMVEGSPQSGRASSTANQTSTSRSSEPRGFWESLGDLFLPDEDRYTYAEGLSRGGYLVTVTVTDALYERALDILDDEGTVNIDERAQSWRSEGWTGWEQGRKAGYGQSEATRSTTRDESIPIVEENLQVGKREVNQGRVRVRSYVVEKPVQEQVTLREENVSVERRPVDRPLTGTEDAFRERTIEAQGKREEAVVNKQARVTEEVVLKKDANQRTETVSDKVRETKVEVDDQRKTGRRNDREAG